MLERIQEDEQWQVVISAYLDERIRYDEWIPCDDPKQAKEFIKTFPEAKAYEFSGRALAWQENENARLTDANA